MANKAASRPPPIGRLLEYSFLPTLSGRPVAAELRWPALLLSCVRRLHSKSSHRTALLGQLKLSSSKFYRLKAFRKCHTGLFLG
jgi:hypothetical protein